MKKDSLKEFVSVNRDFFEDQKPGPRVLNNIHGRLKLYHTPAKPQSTIVKFGYWWAAAVLIIGISYFAVFENATRNKNTIAQRKEVRSTPAAVAKAKESLETSQKPELGALADSQKKQQTETMLARKDLKPDIGPDGKMAQSATTVNQWAEALKSESSSKRLSAVLKLADRNSLLSVKDLHILFNTMSHDESSNVRLAVLDLLKQQQTQPLVEDFILQSVAKQDDPVVQMQLLSSLSSNEAVKIKKQLQDLSQDPNNIDLVRQQACAVLFRSNINI